MVDKIWDGDDVPPEITSTVLWRDFLSCGRAFAIIFNTVGAPLRWVTLYNENLQIDSTLTKFKNLAHLLTPRKMQKDP
jgi:hypothetical protein